MNILVIYYKKYIFSAKTNIFLLKTQYYIFSSNFFAEKSTLYYIILYYPLSTTFGSVRDSEYRKERT